jgi:hypothetical protein
MPKFMMAGVSTPYNINTNIQNQKLACCGKDVIYKEIPKVNNDHKGTLSQALLEVYC